MGPKSVIFFTHDLGENVSKLIRKIPNYIKNFFGLFYWLAFFLVSDTRVTKPSQMISAKRFKGALGDCQKSDKN